MNFKPELAEKVMAGEKTVTRRLVSENPNSPWAASGCRLKVGHSYAVCPGRGKNAIGRVVVRRAPLEMLTATLDDADAIREGFPHRVAFEQAWKQINRSFDPAAWVWRVDFTVEGRDLTLDEMRRAAA
jgi:hypothetical protein